MTSGNKCQITYDRVPLGSVDDATGELFHVVLARRSLPHRCVTLGVNGGQMAEDVVVGSRVFLRLVHVQR